MRRGRGKGEVGWGEGAPPPLLLYSAQPTLAYCDVRMASLYIRPMKGPLASPPPFPPPGLPTMLTTLSPGLALYWQGRAGQGARNGDGAAACAVPGPAACLQTWTNITELVGAIVGAGPASQPPCLPLLLGNVLLAASPHVGDTSSQGTTLYLTARPGRPAHSVRGSNSCQPPPPSLSSLPRSCFIFWR